MKPKSRSANLSKHVLQMKFMKRSALQAQVDLAEEEQQRLIDSEHWYLNVPQLKTHNLKVNIEPSYVLFDTYSNGRMSFQGFNPEIEKLMKQKESEEEGIIEEDDEKDVDDEEMADYYQGNAASATIGKKFINSRPIYKHFQKEKLNSKQKRKSDEYESNQAIKKKKNFVKPSLDD